MSGIETAIRCHWKDYTVSEQKLASFFLQHLQDLPFETAASIAQGLKLSPMTVARFIKKLGYEDLRAIKEELRSGARSEEFLGNQISRTLFSGTDLSAKDIPNNN